MKTLTALAALTLATPAIADTQYHASVSLASYHINATRDFNESNFGLGLGVSWGGDIFRYGLEAGFFENSYHHQSTYVSSNWNWKVADFEHVNILIGGYGAFAGYPNLTGYADKYGIPRIGDHIMIGGFTFSA